MLTEGKIVSITYKNKAEDKISERTIIPTFVPSPNIKALDVSHLSDSERQNLMSLFQEWKEYYDLHCKQAYDFATWVEMTTNQKIEPKFRTFFVENITINQ